MTIQTVFSIFLYDKINGFADFVFWFPLKRLNKYHFSVNVLELISKNTETPKRFGLILSKTTNSMQMKEIKNEPKYK